MCNDSAAVRGSGSANHVPEYVHLHGHTQKSKGDAISTTDRLAKKAIDSGMKAIAVTDHGVASAWIEMHKSVQKAVKEARTEAVENGMTKEEAEKQINLKFIPGCEMYETNDRTIKSKAEMDKHGYSTHHFLMLVRNEEGMKNLNRIISDASWNGQFSGRNRTDMKTIEQNGWGKGIIATSACLASRTSKYILEGRYEEAKQFALYCDTIFDEFYLELQDNNVKDQYIVNQALIQMSKETGLPLVFTQDYHYVDSQEEDIHDTWICIGRGNKKNDSERQGYDGGPYHLATPAEMYQSVQNGTIPLEAYENTVKIAEKCSYEFELGVNRYPHYPFIPQGYTADSYLRHITREALYKYAIQQDEVGKPIDMQTYIERLDYELQIISDKGFSDYFLILNDIFNFCRQKNIYVGPGRGSGAGALTAFLAGITGIDPIEHGLLFERFLNPERMSAPDIDYDISHWRRDEVFQYIVQRFGADKTAQIITYGREKLRSAMDDLCRVLEEKDENDQVIAYGQDVANEIKKTIPVKFPDQTEATYASMKKLAENPDEFRERFRDQTNKLHEQAKDFMAYMNQYPALHEGVKKLEGQVRNFGRILPSMLVTA